MAEQVRIIIDGTPLLVPAGTVLSAALIQAGIGRFRRSVSGESRAPLCGMGMCFECCVTINGEKHLRSCKVICDSGMEVRTNDV